LLLQAQNISKSFGATQALQNVAIQFSPGQVHALVGENGAGKSTLFKILAGALQKDSGTMTMNGAPYNPRNLHEAQAAGALVFQEITVNPSLGIAENIFIDRMSQFAGFLGLSRWKRIREAAQQILDTMDSGISVSQKLETLDLGQMKIIEIARALSYNPKVLLLDESTAFLSTNELNSLFKVINTLSGQGIAIGFISHHLEEIEKVGDIITILKDGQLVGEYARGELTNDQIEGRMVGREIGHDMYPTPTSTAPLGVVLELQNLTIPGQLRDVTLELRKGEVLGIGGLKGSGGEALLNALIGEARPSAGQILLEGQRYHPRSPSDAWERGIAYLPGDRTGEGLIVDFSVQDNLSMASIPRRGIFVDRGTERQRVEELIDMLQIKAQRPTISCSSLSGGNLQKVVLGKCVAPKPRVLLLNNPTRGIDVGARFQIYNIIRKLVDDGISVILLSEDLPELIGMSDRIIVMRKGKISNAFEPYTKPTEQEVVTYMI
jgi:ABC-type sugar transport system ATPase subunit